MRGCVGWAVPKLKEGLDPSTFVSVWENLGDAPQIPVFKAHTVLRKTTLVLTLQICTETQDGGKGSRALLMFVFSATRYSGVFFQTEWTPPQSSLGNKINRTPSSPAPLSRLHLHVAKASETSPACSDMEK